MGSWASMVYLGISRWEAWRWVSIVFLILHPCRCLGTINYYAKRWSLILPPSHILLFRYVWLYVLKPKNMFEIFKQTKAIIKKHINQKMKRLHTYDNIEIWLNKFKGCCKDKGILRHHIVRDIFQQNGIAKKWTKTHWKELTSCFQTSAYRISYEHKLFLLHHNQIVIGFIYWP